MLTQLGPATAASASKIANGPETDFCFLVTQCGPIDDVEFPLQRVALITRLASAAVPCEYICVCCSAWGRDEICCSLRGWGAKPLQKAIGPPDHRGRGGPALRGRRKPREKVEQFLLGPTGA